MVTIYEACLHAVAIFIQHFVHIPLAHWISGFCSNFQKHMARISRIGAHFYFFFGKYSYAVWIFLLEWCCNAFFSTLFIVGMYPSVFFVLC